MSGEQRIPPRPAPARSSGVAEKNEADRLRDHVGDLTQAVNDVTVVTGRNTAAIGELHRRFDTFHGELSLMRGMLGDLIPRVTSAQTVATEAKTEAEAVKRTLPQKVGGGTMVGAKWGSYILTGGVILGFLAKAFPNLPVLQQIADLVNQVTP